MAEDVRLELVIDGATVIIEPLDVTGVEWRDIKTATGLSVRQVMDGVSDLDLDAVAGLAWNVLRRTDPALTVDDVLGGLSLRTLVEAGERSADDEQDDADPSV
jgi:hypothetical protein